MVQAVDETNRRGPGRLALVEGFARLAQVEVKTGHRGLLGGLPATRAERHHGETRRARPALLRGGDNNVDVPRIHGQADGAQRRNGVDDEELVKLTLYDLGDALEVVGDAGGRLVVGDEHGLDGRVSLQLGADLG